jgi:iron complex transport system substrate-binding protein
MNGATPTNGACASSMRIVSLVPAGTDILLDLGLGRSVVGVSHECDSAGCTDVPRLTRSVVHTETMSSAEIDAAVSAQAASGGPMYEVDVGQLLALQPDLIVSQSLCDVCALPAHAVERVLAVAGPNIPLVSLDGRSIDGMLASIEDIGSRTGRAARARELTAELRRRLARVAAAVSGLPATRVVCLEWLDPPYACGHWIPEMIERAGGHDLLGRPGIPSIPIPWDDIRNAHAPIVIAMPCGYDLPRAVADVALMQERHEWRSAVGDAVVYAAAGGAYFTRPGPQLVTGIEVLASVLHPEAVDWPVPGGVIARRGDKVATSIT